MSASRQHLHDAVWILTCLFSLKSHIPWQGVSVLLVGRKYQIMLSVTLWLSPRYKKFYICIFIELLISNFTSISCSCSSYIQFQFMFYTYVMPCSSPQQVLHTSTIHHVLTSLLPGACTSRCRYRFSGAYTCAVGSLQLSAYW